MRQFTIYDKTTGEISKVLTQSKEPRLDLNEAMIEGNYQDDLFCVVDGAPVPLVQTKAADLTNAGGGSLNVLTAEDETRIVRNQMLASSDWTQLQDAPVDQAAWAVYRQALRDLPANMASFESIVWPTPP